MRITIELRRPPIRRLPFAIAIVAVLLLAPVTVFAVHQFSDVPTGASYHDDVEALVAAGITTGCGDGIYCPSSAVTRGQMAQFLNRLGSLDGSTAPSVDADKVDGLDSADFLPAATYLVLAQGTPPLEAGLTIDASCDGGDRAISGGFAGVGETTHLSDSFPFDADTWRVFVLDGGTGTDNVVVVVQCADFAPLHVPG